MCSVCLWRRGDRRGKGEEWRGGASPSPHPHWKDYFKQIEMFSTYHFKQISKCTATLPPGLRTDPCLTNIFTGYFINNVSRSYFCIIFNKFLLHIHAAACFKLNWFCSTGPQLWTLPKALRTQALTTLTSNFGLVRYFWLGRFGLVGLVWWVLFGGFCLVGSVW